MNHEYPQKRIRFTGKFTDLIPSGFTFQKLFARNYCCYRLQTAGQNLWVWRHLGGYVEIDDNYDSSYLILEAILDPNVKRTVHDEVKNEDGSVLMPGWEMLELAIDRETQTIEVWDKCRHEPGFLINVRARERGVPFLDEERYDEIIDEVYEELRRYKRCFICNETEDRIRDLHDRGWLAIEDYPGSLKKPKKRGIQ